MLRLSMPALLLALAGCATKPPANPDNLCEIFREKPKWHEAALKMQQRWGAPVQVPMAMMYQESSFKHDALPPRYYFLGFIPWGRVSSAYGYAQAKDETWADYKREAGGWGASRDDDAPPVKALDASIRALEKEVQDEGATVQSSEDRAPNTLTTHLERVLLDETSNNAALRTQLAEQEKQLAELEAQRREALDIEPTLARLQRELNATERNYALYVDSLEKSRIDRELDKSQISNISVIEEATYNPGRIFPKTLLMLFLAVPFGLAVGLLVVYLCYLLDQRIHDGGLVEEKFGLPLWTTLPELSNSTAESSNAFTASIYRLYGLLPYARIEEKGLTLGLTSARHGEGVTFIIEQLRRLLEENGVRVRVGGEPAQPGEVVLLDAPALLDSREAFIALRRADLIALVVEAQKSTVPVVEHALTILTTAFGKVDGIIINRRRFEVPSKVLQTIARYRSAF